MKENYLYFCTAFETRSTLMVGVVQLVRASDCGSECRGFESLLPPVNKPCSSFELQGLLLIHNIIRNFFELYG